MDLSLLQHSAFLNALGNALIDSLWQGCVLWGLYHAALIIYKKNTAAYRNACATILVFLSFALFFISFTVAFLHKEQINNSTAFYTEIVHTPAHLNFSLALIIRYVLKSLPFLSVAYIFLLLFLMVRLIKAYRYIYMISNQLFLKAAPGLNSFAQNVALQINFTKKISVWISEYIDVPATIGFFKPIILIPLASINNLSSHQLEAIILHELFHVKRNDYIVNLIISVIETVLFFNPFVMLLSKVIKRERENCCDDFVLQYQYDPHTYAAALLQLEEARITSIKLAMGAVSGKQQLLSRIKRITNDKNITLQFNYGQKIIALITITGIICSFAWLTPENKRPLLLHKNQDISLNKKISAAKNLSNVHEPAIIKPDKKEILIQKADDTNEKKEANSERDLANVQEENLIKESIDVAQLSTKINNVKIQLPKSIKLDGIPFLPKNFSIDLSKIDVNNLNKNLQLAYKQINALDWKKIQEKINQSMRQENVKALAAEMQDRFNVQKITALSELRKARFNFDSAQKIVQSEQETLKRLITDNKKSILLQKLKQEKLSEMQDMIKQSATNFTKLLKFSLKNKSDSAGESVINIKIK